MKSTDTALQTTANVGLAWLLDALGVDPDEHVSVCHKTPGGAFEAEVMTAVDAPAGAAR